MSSTKPTSNHPCLLTALGWNDSWQASFNSVSRPDCRPARVLSTERGCCLLGTATGEVRAAVSGRLVVSAGEWPIAVGDWVAAGGSGADWVVEEVLPRKSHFVRQVSGRETRRQVLAANVDTVFLIMAATEDFNLRRLERYLVIAWESGARPVVLLSKADLCSDLANRVATM